MVLSEAIHKSAVFVDASAQTRARAGRKGAMTCYMVIFVGGRTGWTPASAAVSRSAVLRLMVEVLPERSNSLEWATSCSVLFRSVQFCSSFERCELRVCTIIWQAVFVWE